MAQNEIPLWDRLKLAQSLNNYKKSSNNPDKIESAIIAIENEILIQLEREEES